MYPPPNFFDTPKLATYDHVDWYSATFPVSVKISNIIPQDVRIERCKSPIPVYPHAFKTEPYGIKILYGGGDRLGTHVIWSGKCLEQMRNDGYTDEGIYTVIKLNGGKLSRADIAIDVFNSVITPEDFIMRGYDCSTSLKGTTEISKGDNKETVYLGNPKSRKRKLRVYDKAIEQGIESLKWIRIEYEKRYNADKMIETLVKTEATIKSLIKSVIDYPHWHEYQQVMNCEATPVLRGAGAEKSDTEYSDKMNWLVTSAAPLLAKLMVKDAVEKGQDLSETDAINTFISVLNVEISKIINGVKS